MVFHCPGGGWFRSSEQSEDVRMSGRQVVMTKSKLSTVSLKPIVLIDTLALNIHSTGHFIYYYHYHHHHHYHYHYHYHLRLEKM